MFSRAVPLVLGILFVILNWTRNRTVQKYLVEKPRWPDPDSGNIRALTVGKVTFYVTEGEHRLFMRSIYLSFSLVVVIMSSIALGSTLSRLLRR